MRGGCMKRLLSLLALPISLLALPIVAIAGDNSSGSATSGRIFFLDLRGHRLVSANPDGSDAKNLVANLTQGPDGVVVDPAHGHIYWTNMGRVSENDGSVERANLDGSNVVTVVPVAGTFTAKQLKLDAKHGKLYWSDREGMRIQRADLDGSHLQTLYISAHGDEARKDARNWCVGIALDLDRG